LKDWDYTAVGWYSITICTGARNPFFGKIEDGDVRRSHLGKVALQCRFKIPNHFSQDSFDAFIIMPNHVIGIIGIEEISTVGATRPTKNEIMDSNIQWVNKNEDYRDGSSLWKDCDGPTTVLLLTQLYATTATSTTVSYPNSDITWRQERLGIPHRSGSSNNRYPSR
jgi:hypothetical protein